MFWLLGATDYDTSPDMVVIAQGKRPAVLKLLPAVLRN